MTEQEAKSATGAEPSMEDILASIRRILADEGGGADAEQAAAASAEPRKQPSAASPSPAVAAARQGDRPRPQPQALAAEPAAAFPPRAVPFADEVFGGPFGRNDEEDVFVLTPEMRIEVAAGSIGGERIVSDRTAANGTDVLAQLASAILDRRDIAVSSRDMTLEGMVREMLRPLLREWLDRNLPYLIERLVKREIDLMINRAERLED